VADDFVGDLGFFEGIFDSSKLADGLKTARAVCELVIDVVRVLVENSSG
jgi:hypothetical protein